MKRLFNIAGYASTQFFIMAIEMGMPSFIPILVIFGLILNIVPENIQRLAILFVIPAMILGRLVNYKIPIIYKFKKQLELDALKLKKLAGIQ